MKEVKEKEKSENEKTVKELEERRAKKHSLDVVIDQAEDEDSKDNSITVIDDKIMDNGETEIPVKTETLVNEETDNINKNKVESKVKSTDDYKL